MEARKRRLVLLHVKPKTLRFALNRHFKAVRGVDIMTDEFSEANKVFRAKCVQLKKDGYLMLT